MKIIFLVMICATSVKKRNVSYLGSIPLQKSIRENSDAGKLSDQPAYQDVAKKILN